ncbi:FAD/NADP-binding domain-containing protein [Dacryopinax primogenitus]|uniref:FAD/NADP-binding domain-containing protein n=1 Tax=Dacryopinax primogenitus (strain DJM 731) TaxID=1858805 RepID=M5FTG0_DACPD|nr:FAD/NADP-binding domain-containing protein [Dacryopinax primogenitus]EJT99353.1 FAD/NADP-binding domain-containing protein [Dacryopinax primogenitus]
MASAFVPVPVPILGAPLDPSSIDEDSVAQDWLARFSDALASIASTDSSLSRFFVSSCDAWWKDHLALTWAHRTARCMSTIDTLFGKAIESRKPREFQLVSATVISMGPQIGYIQVMFKFTTTVAKCSGIVKLVPEQGEWKAWTIFTKMDDLLDHTRDLSKLDSPDKTTEVPNEVEVLIFGAGQAGLQVAANLRALGMSTLVVERGDRVGDHWRGRYDTLRLHLSKDYSELSLMLAISSHSFPTGQLAYRPWPADFPYYPSLYEVADGLESYSKSTHLNILTSSCAIQATYSEEAHKWTVDILSQDGTKKKMYADQLVFATGVNGATPSVPYVAGEADYQGTVIHSSAYKDASHWKNKKAIVIGAAASGHDIAQDLCNNGTEVTLVQRSPTMVLSISDVKAFYGRVFRPDGPPLEIADLIWESTPIPVSRTLSRRALKSEALDKKYEALRKAGFLVADLDPMDAVYNRGGGHYIDVGGSDLIIDGKIKMKAGVPITHFTTDGLAFDDGTTLDADLVVFATGYNLQSMSQAARKIVGDEIGTKLKDVWGLDAENHLRAMHRNSGHPRLWYAGGDFGMSRYYAKILALQVLATAKGLLTNRLED